jgi:hypothetical protein
MVVEFVDGEWWIDAPWLTTPAVAPTFEAAYELAIRRRHDPSQRPR